jgi:hypothetical protein
VEYALRDDSDRVENDGGSPRRGGGLTRSPSPGYRWRPSPSMVVHVVLCMISMVDQTGGGVLIMAGTGVLNMADTMGIVFEVNFTYLLQLHSFFELIYSVMYLQSFTRAKVEN